MKVEPLLQVAVIAAVGVTFALKVDSFSTRVSRGGVGEQDDSHRNERSTPRSFVLPATPAVAIEQELRGGAERDKTGGIERCVERLRVLGYEIYGDEAMDNVKVLEAIIMFQVASKLGATGTLDEPTLKALKCVY